MPAGGLFLTAGADVQKDRIEVNVWAWGRGLESWLVEHVVIDGGPGSEAYWAGINELLGRLWTHANGQSLTITLLGCVSRSRRTHSRSAPVHGRFGPASAPDERTRRSARRAVCGSKRWTGCEVYFGQRRTGPGPHRASARRHDHQFGDARVWSEAIRLDVRASEVAEPRPGDAFEIDGDSFVIQGEPVRDREQLVWKVELRPA